MTLESFWSFSIFGLVFFVLKFLLGIARQWSRGKFEILTRKPQSHVRILIYQLLVDNPVLIMFSLVTSDTD